MSTKYERLPLDSICRPKQWKTLSKNMLLKQGYPVYGANGIIGFYDKYNHDEETILITCRGATCGVINVCEAKSYVNGNAMALNQLDSSKVDLRFLVHQLNYRGLEDVITGTAQPQITRTTLSKVNVELPSLDEQKRIAAILDKADAIRQKRKEAIKLTEELLRSTFLEMFGDPVTNPKGWPVKPLGEILEKIDSGWSPRCETREPLLDEWGVLKLGSVSKNVFIPIAKFLPDFEPKKERLVAGKGQLLFARKNTYDLVGTAAYVFESPQRLLVPDLIFSLIPKEKYPNFKSYLWQVLIFPGFRPNILNLAGGSAGSMPNISKRRLSELKVPVPPAALRIDWETYLVKYQALNQRTLDSEASETLFDALVQRAFKGEL